MSNIAEGFERTHLQEKIQFYNVARGSAGEVRSLLYVISDNFADATAEAERLRDEVTRVGKLVTGLLNSTVRRRGIAPRGIVALLSSDLLSANFHLLSTAMSDSVAIAVVGLGYVGLPLSIQFARSGVTVLGIDVDSKKVELLNNGQSYIKHVSEDGIREMVDGGKFSATTDFSRIKEVEAVIICVPTPLTKNREPDISYVIETGRSIAPYLKSAEADLKIEDGRSKIGEAGSRAPHPHPLPDRGGEGEAMAGPSSELPTANSQPLKS